MRQAYYEDPELEKGAARVKARGSPRDEAETIMWGWVGAPWLCSTRCQDILAWYILYLGIEVWEFCMLPALSCPAGRNNIW